jgi:cell division protein FtsW
MQRPGIVWGDTNALVAGGLLLALGLIFLSSASAPLAYERFGSRSYYLVHQILSGVLPGLLAFVLISRVRRGVIQRVAVPLFAMSCILLLLVFVPGIGVARGGARSWLSLGITFQPSEVMKLGLILALSAWLSNRRPSWFDLRSWTRGLLPILGVLGLVLGLIAAQPDTGTLVILGAIGVSIAFAAGIPWRHVFALTAAGGALLSGLILAAPYRLARLTTFLHPELDPQGIGYQVNQALFAVGSGGIFGLGLGHSRQKFSFLPEILSDSIFAIIAEEIGFVFSVLLITLIMYFIWRILFLARHSSDAFDRLVFVGIASWWGVQSMVNIGAMLGVLPITGLPLPFVSYGGTAMAMTLASMGVVANLSRDRERKK